MCMRMEGCRGCGVNWLRLTKVLLRYFLGGIEETFANPPSVHPVFRLRMELRISILYKSVARFWTGHFGNVCAGSRLQSVEQLVTAVREGNTKGVRAFKMGPLGGFLY